MGVTLHGQVRIVSVGRAKYMPGPKEPILTGFLKDVSSDPLELTVHGFVSDEHVYPSHGNPDRAVLSYEWSSYAYWRDEHGLEMPTHSAFGENLTTEGLPETLVQIGDIFSVGSAVIQASEPRRPCAKVAARYSEPRMSMMVIHSGRTGILYRVLTPGTVQVGDQMTLLDREGHGFSVADANRILHRDLKDMDGARALLSVDSLSIMKKNELLSRLERESDRKAKQVS